jgi:hypothetical protein
VKKDFGRLKKTLNEALTGYNEKTRYISDKNIHLDNMGGVTFTHTTNFCCV